MKSINSSYKRLQERYNVGAMGSKDSPASLFDNQIRNGTADENETWFNTYEASNFLSITPNALRILVHRAKVRAYKLGSRLRFRKSDLVLTLHPKED